MHEDLERDPSRSAYRRWPQVRAVYRADRYISRRIWPNELRSLLAVAGGDREQLATQAPPGSDGASRPPAAIVWATSEPRTDVTARVQADLVNAGEFVRHVPLRRVRRSSQTGSWYPRASNAAG